jgi:hypothetical protein
VIDAYVMAYQTAEPEERVARVEQLSEQNSAASRCMDTWRKPPRRLPGSWSLLYLLVDPPGLRKLCGRTEQISLAERVGILAGAEAIAGRRD